MKTIIISLLIFFSLIGQKLMAQGNGANLNNNKVVGWNLIPSNLTKEKVEYADVKGNPFWNHDWLPANVSMANGATYNLAKSKLNLYSNEIHFINDKNIELAIQNKLVKSLTFYSSTDTSKIAVFKNLIQPAIGDRESLTQILVNGEIQLLKKASIKLIKQETDPLQTKTEMVFEPRDVYFVNYKGGFHELRNISKSSLFDLIKEKNGDEDWLKTQKNKLRNENEVISFLVYRNTTTP